MSLSVKVPALGESVRVATLGVWKHGEGDHFEADEPLVEVETEKATFEVLSPAPGVLQKILRKAGDTVAVGEAIAEIDQVGSAQVGSPPAARPVAGPTPVNAAIAPGSGVSNQDVVRALEQRVAVLEAWMNAVVQVQRYQGKTLRSSWALAGRLISLAIQIAVILFGIGLAIRACS